MPPCAVLWCKNTTRTSNSKTDGVTFHQFPKDRAFKKKWIEKTKRKSDWLPTKHSKICSKHFAPECLMYTKNGRRRLTADAIPTLLIPTYENEGNVFLEVSSTGKCPDLDKGKDNRKGSKPKKSQSIADEADSVGSGGESPGSGGEGGSGREGACARCGDDVGRRGHRVRGSPAEQSLEAAIFPREVNEKTLLCNECYVRYCNKGNQINPKNFRETSPTKEAAQRVALSGKSVNVNVPTPPTSDISRTSQQTITLPNYKIATCCNDICVFPSCQIKVLHNIPQYEKHRLLHDYKLYTPVHSRICKQHLFSKKWEPVLSIAKSDFTSQQIEDVISILTTNVTAFNVDGIEDIPPNLLLYFTGIDHRQLHDIFARLPILSRKTETPLLALIAYLTKLRTNDSFDRLSALFQITKSRFEKLTTFAKDCMLNEFVPSHSKGPSPSDKTEKTSELTTDDLIHDYLQEHYYKDGAPTEEPKVMRDRCENLASTKPLQCRKRNNSSDSGNASKVRAKKRLTNEETNKSKTEECEQYEIPLEEVEFGSPEREEARFVSESSDDEEESMQPPMKEESDDGSVTVGEGETGNSADQDFVVAPKPTDNPQADPLDIVPAPLLEHVKSEEDTTTVEEDTTTVEEEPGEEDSQAQPVAGTSRPSAGVSCTVYYSKGARNFDQGPRRTRTLKKGRRKKGNAD